MQNRENSSAQKKSPGKQPHHLRYTDFQFIKILGMGAYGKVELVERKGIKYALKIIEKRMLAKQDKEYQAFIERELLRKMKHAGIVSLKTCFQDRQNLYFCLEYCEGGDFITFIRNNEWKMTNELRAFYLAEIVSILEYFNQIKIIHRDLKPQNILLSQRGHIKLVDFATAEVSECKLIDEKFREQLATHKNSQLIQEENKSQSSAKKAWKQMDAKTSSSSQTEETVSEPAMSRKRKATFVGTCYYVPPQLLQHEACSAASDLWALGCIMYQLYYLVPPFDGVSEFEVFQKIKNVQFILPHNQNITQDAIDLIKKLLKKHPEDRLGSNSKEGLMMSDLKAHPYFKCIDFQTIFISDVPLMLQNQCQISQKQKQRLSGTQETIKKQYLNSLQKNPHILIYGVIEKKTFINYNLYHLIIFKNLKILRIKVSEPGKTKEIQIQLNKKFDTKDGNPAQIIDSNFFKLITKEKVYKLKTHQPHYWVSSINSQYKYLKQIKNKEENEENVQGQIQKQCKSISEMLKCVKITLQE